MSIIDQIQDFPEGDKTTDLFPFLVSVFVPKNIAPRDNYFRGWWDANQALYFVERVYNPEAEFDEVMHVVFPENHLCQYEQQDMMSTLLKHKNVHQLKEIMLITNSPLIVGGFRRESIRILSV